MDDYFAAGPLIAARLTAQLAGVNIKSTWGIPRIQEQFDLPPAVLVSLEDDRPDEIVNWTSQKVEQIWTCVVVVSDPDNEAGSLISQVIQAMNGWQPSGSGTPFSPFQRVKSELQHECSPNGVLYFPLAFSTTFVFNS